MSAWDVSGAVVWTALGILFWGGAITPGKPPNPRIGPAEVGCFLLAIPISAASVFCIARLCGAHA